MTERTRIPTMPVLGGRYEDDTGRELEVTGVNPSDPLGRDVTGLLFTSPRNGHAPRPYATDLPPFTAIWRPA